MGRMVVPGLLRVEDLTQFESTFNQLIQLKIWANLLVSESHVANYAWRLESVSGRPERMKKHVAKCKAHQAPLQVICK